MIRDEQILQELQQQAPAISLIENKLPYTVAVGYFDSLSTSILQKIKANQEPVYYFPSEMPYTLPAGYFANFPERVLNLLKEKTASLEVAAELAEVAPLLNTINKQHTYSVPAGYFNQTEAFIQQEKPTGKVVSFSATTVYKWLAAAVVIGILAIGLFLIIGKDSSSLQANKAIKNLSEDEIAYLLSSSPSSEEAISVVQPVQQQNNDIHAAVKQMSDEEIKQFLQDSEAQGI